MAIGSALSASFTCSTAVSGRTTSMVPPVGWRRREEKERGEEQ